jgi:hypothetical protein
VAGRIGAVPHLPTLAFHVLLADAHVQVLVVDQIDVELVAEQSWASDMARLSACTWVNPDGVWWLPRAEGRAGRRSGAPPAVAARRRPSGSA